MKTELQVFFENCDKRNNTHFRIRNGEGFYVVGGKEIPNAEFKAKYPIPLVLNIKENSDHTKDFLFGKI